MTVFMLALMEGLYLKKNGLISSIKGRKAESGPFLICMLIIILIGLVWYGGIKPFMGGKEYFKYKRSIARRDLKGAEKYILKAMITCGNFS